MNHLAEVTAWIEKAPENQQEILKALRTLVAATVPQAEEQFKWGKPVYANGKGFSYLEFSKNHVTLGFFNFEKLTDPENKLEGTGKQMRHIKIKTTAAIDKALLSQWLKEAAAF